jgi:DNA-binding CsgD family transcriptional regulator
MTNIVQLDHKQDKSPIALSERELQVIELVAAGQTNLEIAGQLAISKRTVDNHISNILSKTHTDNRVALVRWALQWGKVCIDEVNCCTIPLKQSINQSLGQSLGKSITSSPNSLQNSLPVQEGLERA